MEKIVFTAEIRNEKRKKGTRKLRSKGYIPSIIYGPDIEPVLIKLEKKETEKIIRHLSSHNVMAEMKLKKDGKKETINVILKQIQTDPIKDEILHLDFYKVSEEKAVIMEIPISIVGESIGVKKGGILEHELREIKVEGFVREIPDFIEIDITNLDIGDAIFVKDLKVSEKIKIVEDPERVVVTIIKPKETVEEEKAEQITEEVKVITQEKVEERRREKEES